MGAVPLRTARFAQSDCVPPDPFWSTNRNLAELIWRRGDGATVSTRVAEDVHRTTNIPVRKAKTNLHAVVAGGVGVLTAYLACRVTNDPTLRIAGLVGAGALAHKTFRYLEQDRCR